MKRVKFTKLVFGLILFLVVGWVWIWLLYTAAPIDNSFAHYGTRTKADIMPLFVKFSYVTIVIVAFIAFKDVVANSIIKAGADVGVNVPDMIRQCIQLVKDELLILAGKKDRVSDHHDE